MLSWLTGAKITGEDVEAETFIDETRIDPPETPAPVFAVRAFRQAIFGTPQPAQHVAAISARKRKAHEKSHVLHIHDPVLPTETDLLKLSPTKAGILLTPGTVRGKKKEVTFGKQITDQQADKVTKPGVAFDVPGYYASPWLTSNKLETSHDDKPKTTKLTEAFKEAKATGTNPRRLQSRAKDDADITIDITEPRSESGRYWKEQYTTYSRKSEEEMRKLIAKQRLARDYARKKDEEALELRRQLESQSKRNKARENQMDKQLKDLREKLRVQLAENARSTLEISLLKMHSEVDVAVAPEAIPNPRAAEHSNSFWTDGGVLDDENGARARDLMQGPKPPSHEEHRIYGEQRLARKSGCIDRQDSVVTLQSSKRQALQPELAISSQANYPEMSIQRPPLANRAANITTISPLPSINIPLLSDTKNLNEKVDPSLQTLDDPKSLSRTPRQGIASAAASFSKPTVQMTIYDDLATMAALSLQAEQPIIPQIPQLNYSPGQATLLHSNKRHKRSEATTKLSAVPGLEKERAQAAKDRIQARKLRRSQVRLR